MLEGVGYNAICIVLNTSVCIYIYIYRVVRQIFLCLKYIFDVMFVLFFFVAVFSIMGNSNFKINNTNCMKTNLLLFFNSAYYFFDETDAMVCLDC